MKKTHLLLVGLFFLAIGFYACKKEQAAPAEPSDYPTARRAVNNPLDYLGEIHNRYLDTVAAQTDFRQMSLQDRYDLWVEFNRNNLPNAELSSTDFEAIAESAPDSFPSTLNLIEELLTDGAPVDAAADLQALFDAVGFRSDMTSTGMLTVAEAVAAAENWEDSMMIKYGMPPTDPNEAMSLDSNNGKAAWLLGTSAILKSSYSYWMNVESDSQNPWYVAMKPSSDSSWGSPAMRSLREIWADIKAYIKEIKTQDEQGPGLFIRDVHYAAAVAADASDRAAR